MNRIWLILLSTHLIICLFVMIGILGKKYHIPAAMFPVVLLVPPAGFLASLVVHRNAARKTSDLIEIGLDKLKVNDLTYKSILQSQEIDDELVVPVNEALALNDSNTKRSLIMETINLDPQQYVPVLQKAREYPDSEVSHYAVTAMVEMQKDYEMDLQRWAKRHKALPKDVMVIDGYLKCLQDYMSLGILDGSVLGIYQESYLQLIQKREELAGTNMKSSLRRFDVLMQMKNYSTADELCDKMLEEWPDEGSVYVARIRLCAVLNDRVGIDQTLKLIRERNVFLNTRGRETVQYWSNDHAQ